MSNISRAELINRYLPKTLSVQDQASAFAPSNIALCKYWGKRDSELNLPTNPSLSISLAHLGSHTQLVAAPEDSVTANGVLLDLNSTFARKIFTFINYFRREHEVKIAVITDNNIPTAAGLASSASGFAALTLALDGFFNLQLERKVLSAFARMGSGSAARSLYSGFVKWHMGSRSDGMDSCAEALPIIWKELCVGLIKVDTSAKKTNSTEGMNRTLQTSRLYSAWPAQAMHDIHIIEQAAKAHDIHALGRAAEHNALSMHATMLSAWPPLLYLQSESLIAMQKIWELRENGCPAYITIDAGANLKILFEEDARPQLLQTFANMQIVKPFCNEPNTRI